VIDTGLLVQDVAESHQVESLLSQCPVELVLVMLAQFRVQLSDQFVDCDVLVDGLSVCLISSWLRSECD
jgi:hypothetical protein